MAWRQASSGHWILQSILGDKQDKQEHLQNSIFLKAVLSSYLLFFLSLFKEKKIDEKEKLQRWGPCYYTENEQPNDKHVFERADAVPRISLLEMSFTVLNWPPGFWYGNIHPYLKGDCLKPWWNKEIDCKDFGISTQMNVKIKGTMSLLVHLRFLKSHFSLFICIIQHFW